MFKVIFWREYTSRVNTPMFWTLTILTPALFALITAIPILSVAFTQTETFKVYVHDPGGRVAPLLERASVQNLTFVRDENSDALTLRQKALSEKGSAALILPQDVFRGQLTATFYSAQSPSLPMSRKIEDKIQEAVRRIRLEAAGVALDRQDELDFSFRLNVKKITASGDEEAGAELAYALGYLAALLNYLMIFAYGGLILRAVTEEKVNRIMEVMISSVRPFTLMMGKVVAVACVGLTQFAVWIVLYFIFALAVGLAAGATLPPPDTPEIAVEQQADWARKIQRAIEQFNPALVPWMLFYFVSGFFLFGSLFAAIGAAVDQESDSQQLSMVLSIPAIIPMLILPSVMTNPSGPLAVVASLIPFFAPTIMPVRLAASEPAWWELLLSAALMLAAAWIAVILAAKIYRVGVLMYGKRPTFREIYRWLRAG
ncbi:MAG: ABC transporter permease [Bacteroidia bacterium]|nr:ABC transporter permease [Bacteroidia bacterium]